MQKFVCILISICIISIGACVGCIEYSGLTAEKNAHSFYDSYDLALEKVKMKEEYWDLYVDEKDAGTYLVGVNNYEAASHIHAAGLLALDIKSLIGEIKQLLVQSGYTQQEHEIQQYVSDIITELERSEEIFMHMGLALQYIAEATQGLNTVALKVFGLSDASASEVVNPASQAQYHISQSNRLNEISYIDTIKQDEDRIEELYPSFFDEHTTFSSVWYTSEQNKVDDTCTNVALASNGAMVTASSCYSDTHPEYATLHQVDFVIDGLYGNSHSWVSATPNTGWLMIDIGSIKNISKIVWGRDNPSGWNDRVPKNYLLSGSIDGEQWFTLAEVSDHSFSHAGEDKIREFSPVEARFVKMEITATVDETEPAIDEFEIYTCTKTAIEETDSFEQTIYFHEIGWATTLETDLADWWEVEQGEQPPTEVSFDADIQVTGKVDKMVIFIHYRLDNRDDSGSDLCDIIISVNGFEIAHSNRRWFEDSFELDLSSAIPVLQKNNLFTITYHYQDSYGITVYPDSYILFS